MSFRVSKNINNETGVRLSPDELTTHIDPAYEDFFSKMQFCVMKLF